ncbi:MAG: tetratricopeptide repeat protein [Flavobacteriales bacterium]
MRKILILLFIASSFNLWSQNKVELLNKGIEMYEQENYKEAEDYFKQAVEKDNQYYKANLNAGHSLFRQAINLLKSGDTLGVKKLEEAEIFYKNSSSLTENDNQKAESFYNEGNSQLLSEDLEKAIESYKKSLRLQPENYNTKHNLALAQSLKKKQEKKEEEKEEENKEEKNEKKEQEKQEPQEQELSKEEIEQILQALETEEKEVQEDLQKKKAIGNNKLLKDW